MKSTEKFLLNSVIVVLSVIVLVGTSFSVFVLSGAAVIGLWIFVAVLIFFVAEKVPMESEQEEFFDSIHWDESDF